MQRGIQYIIFIFLAIIDLKGQQQSVLSQYYTTSYIMNPAATGSTGGTNISLASRNQWLGIDGAPRYNLVCAETRFKKLKGSVGDDALFKSKLGRVGLGFSAFNDRNGHFDRTGMQFMYAYHIQLRDYTQLSFGLSGFFYQMRMNDKDMTFREPNDPVFMNGITKVVYVPDANVGVLLSGMNYYVGASVSQMFQANVRFGNEATGTYQMKRCYYVSGGYFIELPSGSMMIEPNVLYKSYDQFKQAEFGFNFHRKKAYWIGASLRTGSAAIFRAGLLWDYFSFCYSFDLGFSSIQKYTHGTHEIVISYRYANVLRQKYLNPY